VPDPPPLPPPDTTPSPALEPTPPSHLTVGHQTFDASVAGLRAYLDSIKSTEPKLYAQLAPDVERLGLGAMAAAGITSIAVMPKRQDVLDVVNKRNRLTPDPIRLQIGYDPTHRLALATAALTF
jgi:hypothetical protein